MNSENESGQKQNSTEQKSTEILRDFQEQKEKLFVNLIAKIIVDIAYQRAYEKSN